MVDQREPELSPDTAIAQASGWKPHDQRWTVLRIHHVLATRTPFIGEIVGETNVEGEKRRVRRKSFDSVVDALNWGAFNQQSALYGELRQKAIAWMGGTLATSVDQAITLLRALVAAARKGDKTEIDAACAAAEAFLEGIDHAPSS